MISPRTVNRMKLPVACRAIFLAAMAGAVAGCGRPPPTRITPQSAAPAQQAERRLPASELTSVQTRQRADVEPSAFRDRAVQPATFQAPVAPPKTEQQVAAEALSRIGPPAVPSLVEALHSRNVGVRRQACEILLRMGPDAKEAVPDLIRLLDDEDQELRKMAARALGRIGPEAAEAVPALMRTMLDQPVRAQALD